MYVHNSPNCNQNMMVITKDRLDTLQSTKMDQRAAAAVESDIASLLSGKTLEQLSSLQRQVQTKLNSSSDEPIDTDYWEALLKKILVWKAREKLRALHEVVLRNRLEELRRRQRNEARVAREELVKVAAKKGEVVIPEVPVEMVEEKEKYSRAMSPDLLTRLRPEDKELTLITEEEDMQNLVGVFF